MTVFQEYADYYDLLYADKNYGAEADYLDRLIRHNCPAAETILNLGCGTGNHDFLLDAKGYRMTGVDLSVANIALAKKKLAGAARNSGSPEFLAGDMRDIRLDRVFDAVLSVFHVMSYLNTNDALQAAFVTAGEHLAPGGVFIFDCWYGPAVLSQLPVARVKRVEDESVMLIRKAEPDMRYNQNRVDVNYELIVRRKDAKEVRRIRETHRMRYLFCPEIEGWLAGAGLELVGAEEWLSGREIGPESWGSCFIAKHCSPAGEKERVPEP